MSLNDQCAWLADGVGPGWLIDCSLVDWLTSRLAVSSGVCLRGASPSRPPWWSTRTSRSPQLERPAIWRHQLVIILYRDINWAEILANVHTFKPSRKGNSLAIAISIFCGLTFENYFFCNPLELCWIIVVIFIFVRTPRCAMAKESSWEWENLNSAHSHLLARVHIYQRMLR